MVRPDVIKRADKAPVRAIYLWVLHFFLVIYSLSHSVVVEIDASDDFSFLKFTQACFVAQQVVNPGEHSMCL